MLVTDDNYSFYFLAEKKALLSQVRSTESFLDKFCDVLLFFANFLSNRLSQNFQNQLFHEFTFPVLQTEAEPAQSVERWPAEREFAGSSPGARKQRRNEGTSFALQTAKQWLNLRLARMTVASSVTDLKAVSLSVFSC